MKKRLLAAVMVAVMSVTMLPGMAFTEETSDVTGAVSEPCTLTEGCTLDAGHDGACLLTDANWSGGVQRILKQDSVQ